MAVERVNTLVVGAGQAGIAASEHLSANGVPHLVVERRGFRDKIGLTYNIHHVKFGEIFQ